MKWNPIHPELRGGAVIRLLSLWLMILSAGNVSAQTRVRPDPGQIRSVVENLEKERQIRASEELERLRMRRVDLASRTHYARQWILSNYEFDSLSIIRELPSELSGLDGQRNPVGGQKSAAAAAADRLKQQRAGIVAGIARARLAEDKMLGLLLDRKSQMNGAIASGRALNFFLAKLSPAAFDHALYRQMIQLPGTASESAAGSPPPAGLLDDGRSTAITLDEGVIRHVRYTRGLNQVQETGRLNKGPLDLEWPRILRREEFSAAREAIQKSRDAAVSELKAGGPVSNATADQLLSGVKRLSKQVSDARLAWMKTGPPEESVSWRGAEVHARLLISGAYRLIEATHADDVLTETFSGGTIEELMAFMYRNHLQFAPADSNGTLAYKTILEQMIYYYHDLQSLRAAIAEVGSSAELESSLAELATPGPVGAMPALIGEEGARAVLEEFRKFDESP
jgi:hypothetical protein